MNVITCIKTRRSKRKYLDKTENLLLAAHALGLAGCWTFCKSDNSTPERTIKKLLQIPKDIDVLCLIPLGWPNPEENVRKKKLRKINDIVHYDRW